MPKPIAFMVMPYGRRSTGRDGREAPIEVDFDRLWFDVYSPVLDSMGYQPVRADADLGAVIIGEILQRLILGDMVVADITLPNANVYYEVGVRHAAKDVGCVLTAADWAEPVFDLSQMRQARFPLSDGYVGPDAAAIARERLGRELPNLATSVSPVFSLIPGYPGPPDMAHLSAFADVAKQLTAFDADVRAAYAAPRGARSERALAVLRQHGRQPVIRRGEALMLIRMLGDLVNWETVLDFIVSLPSSTAEHPLVLEQEYLALAKSTEPDAAIRAIGKLEMMISRWGETSERLGLLGGRYKQLLETAADASDRARYLDQAIDAYARGMMADLNDYYPASNLPRLYRQRARPGDEALADRAAVVAVIACRRALSRGAGDVWVRLTLLGLAFDTSDVAEARRLLAELRAEGEAPWKLTTTVNDLRVSLSSRSSKTDDDVRRQLAEILAELEELLRTGA